MNFPYHVVRFHNQEELKLLTNIISRMLQGLDKTKSSEYKADFINAQKRQITSFSNKGVIFKEQAYPGWQARISTGNTSQKAKIYKVGPASPGFMYVSIPEKLRGQSVKVTFSYYGSFLSWFYNILSFLVSLLILENFLFNGLFIGQNLNRLLNFIKKRLGRWWEKEDENI